MEDEVLNGIAIGERRATDLLSDIRWRRAVRGLPDAEHRISLIVALFERALVPSASGDNRWHGAIDRYFSLLYAFDDVSASIWDTGYYGLGAVRREPANREAGVELDKAFMRHKSSGAFNVIPSGVVASAPRLVALLEPESMEGRMALELIERTNNGAATASWLSESLVAFDRLLARARRQRNAITHGTRTIPDVIASVEPFLDQLAGRLIGALRYCASEQNGLVETLEAWRLIRLQRWDALKVGGDPALLYDWNG